MKVILLQDVAKVGLRHDTVEVPNGYALNKLIPKQQAVPATPENQQRMKRELEKRAEANKVMETAFADANEALQHKTLTITVEANEKGHMFEALKPESIVAAAKEENITLTPEMIEIDAPIKEVGEHTLMLTNGTDKQPFTVVLQTA